MNFLNLMGDVREKRTGEKKSGGELGGILSHRHGLITLERPQELAANRYQPAKDTKLVEFGRALVMVHFGRALNGMDSIAKGNRHNTI